MPDKSNSTPSLVFIPGSWHKPACYHKVVNSLQSSPHNLTCRLVTLPSTLDNPTATFKDDLDAARDVIVAETETGRDVIIIAHSYGGMVGNSVIKGLTTPKSFDVGGDAGQSAIARNDNVTTGHVIGLVLIASGFTITGLSFMDPLFGIPPPSWRVDRETGYAQLVADPRQLFYHDLSSDEAEYWTHQLSTQSLKALFEGGEYAYSGWRDVPTWYVGTSEDRGLPVWLQRVQVGMARGSSSSKVNHVELTSGHSPFLSRPEEVVEVILDAAHHATLTRTANRILGESSGDAAATSALEITRCNYAATTAKLTSPRTWFSFGIPFMVGRMLGFVFAGVMWTRRMSSRH